MSWAWNYKSSIKAHCGVDGCQKRFNYRQSWVEHCKKEHPAYYELWLNESQKSEAKP